MSTADQPGVYTDGYDSKRPLAGTEDYRLVTIADAGHYDINEIRFFYSPIAQRYFWYADTGWEGSDWGFNLDRASEMESGDRRDALRALDQWCTEEGEVLDWKQSTVEILGYQEPPA